MSLIQLTNIGRSYQVGGSELKVLRNVSLTIEEGEFVIVPKGVEHRPFAEDECHVVLFEPATTLNTGNVEDEFTKKKLETI